MPSVKVATGYPEDSCPLEAFSSEGMQKCLTGYEKIQSSFAVHGLWLEYPVWETWR